PLRPAPTAERESVPVAVTAPDPTPPIATATPSVAEETRTPERAPELDPPRRREPVELADAGYVGTIAGEEVRAGELLSMWMLREPDRIRGLIEQLVVRRLAEREGNRLGIRVTEPQAEAAFQSALALREQDVREGSNFQSLAEYVTSLGIDPESYTKLMREEVESSFLVQRVVRSWTLTQERSVVRAILARDEAGIEEAMTALDQGEDFAAVAKRLSLERSAEDGGLLPPILDSELPLARLAFATEVGEVGGPMKALGGQLLLQVEERIEPIEGELWSTIAPDVEASLAEEPIDQFFEFEQWIGAMQGRYEIDLRALQEVSGLLME
ncbi:MAG: peptidylprolyl isomerase, partial [Planctomycetota bacterium]